MAVNLPQLRQALLDLPPRHTDGRGRGWDWRSNEIRRKLLRSNPEQFLRWPIVIGAMFTQDEATRRELDWLEGQPDWAERWQPALREPGFGNPDRLPEPYAWTSGGLVTQAFHLAQWEQSSGREIGELDSILEVGGGYGAMCWLCYQLGFDGVYQIADLPELSLLQQYYLSQLEGVEGACPNLLNGLRWSIQPEPAELLIACYSLSEMPVADRASYLQCGHAHRLLAVQDYFNDVYNLEWLRALDYPGKEEDQVLAHLFRPGLFHVLDAPLTGEEVWHAEL